MGWQPAWVRSTARVGPGTCSPAAARFFCHARFQSLGARCATPYKDARPRTYSARPSPHPLPTPAKRRWAHWRQSSGTLKPESIDRHAPISPLETAWLLWPDVETVCSQGAACECFDYKQGRFTTEARRHGGRKACPDPHTADFLTQKSPYFEKSNPFIFNSLTLGL